MLGDDEYSRTQTMSLSASTYQAKNNTPGAYNSALHTISPESHPLSLDSRMASSDDHLSLLPEEQARIALENEKRDRSDADFQIPTPRKRAAREQAVPPGSSKKQKKGKNAVFDTAVISEPSTEVEPVQNDQELQEKVLLVESIQDIWRPNHAEWPTHDFAPVASRISVRSDDKGKKRLEPIPRLEPIHWSLPLLTQVHKLSMIRPDEQLSVVRRAIEQAVGERNSDAPTTAHGNTMTTRDIDVAIKKLEDTTWSMTEFPDTRSPTFMSEPEPSQHDQNETVPTKSPSIEHGQLVQDLLSAVKGHPPIDSHQADVANEQFSVPSEGPSLTSQEILENFRTSMRAVVQLRAREKADFENHKAQYEDQKKRLEQCHLRLELIKSLMLEISECFQDW